MEKRRVAITGLSAITAIGQGNEAYWSALLEKKVGIGRITRFDPAGHSCQIAAEVRDFDPTAYLAKKEIRHLDLFAQYALVAAAMSIQDAGLQMDKENPTRCGVILGAGIGGIAELEAQHNVMLEKGVSRMSPFLIPKLMINAAVAEISIRYHLQGVSFIAASACASSAHAVGLAMRMIQYGEADVVVSGGSEATITPVGVGGFCALRALSTRNDAPEKACRPFDRERDGFVMGEGAGILILEELTRAQARGAPIYAEILGVGWNGDAHHVTQPSPGGTGAAQAIKMALQDARVNPEEVNYINAHGTSTPQNDSMETFAIKAAFGQAAYQIPISSTKSMIGHLIGASGAVELVATALSVKHDAIHPTAGYEIPDPECDLDYVPGCARELPVHVAISNSFGFGGHNVTLVVGKLR